VMNGEIVGFFNDTLRPTRDTLSKGARLPSCRTRESRMIGFRAEYRGSWPRTSRSSGPWLALRALAAERRRWRQGRGRRTRGNFPGQGAAISARAVPGRGMAALSHVTSPGA
jgi:hypothetical protein